MFILRFPPTKRLLGTICLLIWNCKIIPMLRFSSIMEVHNIIQIHNNALWDWQYFTKYSSHSGWMWKISCRILSIPMNTLMNLNYVMCFLKVLVQQIPCSMGRSHRIVFMTQTTSNNNLIMKLSKSMNGENRPFCTYEPVEFEK